MKSRFLISAAPVALALALAAGAAARTRSGKDSSKDAGTTSSSVSATHTAQDDAMRLEGEKRYHANCSRCHLAPPKFSPRMVATVVRHMRVRATLTDEDMRFIIHYMSE
jgi:cytochrome c5